MRNGVFSSRLDFGEQVFDGSPRWLAVAVRSAGASTYTNLVPRIELNASPYAIKARTAAIADMVKSGSVVKSLNGLTDNVTLASGANVSIVPSGNTLTISAAGSGGASYWSMLGTNTYYNLGNVGLGTSNPATKLEVRGPLTLETGGDATLYTGTGGTELNRYLNLINSPGAQSASGLKAGGILVSDSYAYGNPGKNELIVKGNVAVGGNAMQNRDKGGWIKAMARINADGTVARQYSAFGGTITASLRNLAGLVTYRVRFPFQVNDRFISVTPIKLPLQEGYVEAGITAFVKEPCDGCDSSTVEIQIEALIMIGGGQVSFLGDPNDFYIFVY
jgi:hypothetical protein